MPEELAIIRNPKYGNRQMEGMIGLYFSVELAGGIMADLFLDRDEAVDLCYIVQDVSALEGKACMVVRDGSTVQFRRIGSSRG